jgi:uncharacterized protein YndB with AHSA1/START domain
VDDLYEAFVDPRRRSSWLNAKLRTRTATPAKHARFDFDGGPTRLAVYFAAKGSDRSTVTVQHEKLPDAEAASEMKAFWKAELTSLQRLLEGAG